MRRRDFITLLIGALGWPIAVRGQQPSLPVIGLLMAGSPQSQAYRVIAFKRGLNDLGYVEGQNVTIEYRWAENQYERLPALAADLVNRQVAVLVASNNAAAVAAKASTQIIPIVFEVGTDPVKLGLTNNLARPGQNLTGLTFLSGQLAAKLLELLHQTVPQAMVIGLLENPANPNAEIVRHEVQSATNAIGRKLVVAPALVESDIERAFTFLVQQRVDALVVRSDTLFNDRPEQVVALAARHALPAIYSLREFAAAGGLMSYGASLTDALHQVGVYTGRILRGEKPGDLPVQQSTKVELVINLKTAKTLGLTFPISLLGRADEVIE